jgi:hypothetical protein
LFKQSLLILSKFLKSVITGCLFSDV